MTVRNLLLAALQFTWLMNLFLCVPFVSIVMSCSCGLDPLLTSCCLMSGNVCE
jgi:hypothetical protein